PSAPMTTSVVQVGARNCQVRERYSSSRGWPGSPTEMISWTRIRPKTYFGFPVGAGTAALADLIAVRALAEWDFERLDATSIPAQIPLGPVPGGIYTAVTDEASGANVTVIASGWGDGVYPTFIGYAPSGMVSSFTTDFMVIPLDAETL